ncbi:hypothetical protein GZH47_08535 [Paenibacillus rhizovicinus]|uniref:Uncharacterized protein n=1 Tax=Paenibacillus rhizovicinus TaxID=2704463 RepID=A0A6C0NXC5_9BACL|nr:hypothetical protein [Paenibacillus rhizovicinus]QHW30894.1 hypothetical protein GZH47_08535 [Paenibacillus rhizovicinus]
MKCLNCNSKNIGKIGKQHYYCWDCCIEFTVHAEKLDLYQVEKDGTVSSLNDLFIEEIRNYADQQAMSPA